MKESSQFSSFFASFTHIYANLLEYTSFWLLISDFLISLGPDFYESVRDFLGVGSLVTD